MRLIYLKIFLACTVIIFSCKEREAIQEINVDPEALFVHEVLPILEAKCTSCHGNDPKKIEGGLDLRNHENLLKGGDSGNPSLVPGSINESFIVHAINRESEEYAMPPKEGDKLSQLDIDIITKWIEAGAPWPSEERKQAILADTTWSYANRLKVKTSGGLSEAWDNRKYQKEDLWAYYPLGNYEIPSENKDGENGNPIDAFLQQKRAEIGISMAPAAEKRLLLRRASIDLTGLPPTPEELDAFMKDNTTDAFEKVIDRLIKSPHYGEQWGRHWLDVVRYADSGGFSNDYMRPNAWRYRDYVIRSFNQDKPYNQFVVEQIAGDELYPENPEMLIASGFLRMGPWEHTGMSVAAETRQYYLDDVTNIVGETFLGTPLNCAKCHDHKYDPIPTKDYYSLQAVFATTQFAKREAAFLPDENTKVSEFEKNRIIEWIEKTEQEAKLLVEKEEAAAKEWFKENGRAYIAKRERRKLPDHLQPPRYYGLTFEDLGYRKVLQKRMQILRRQKERFDPLAFSVYNGPDRVYHSQRALGIPKEIETSAPNTFILGGGSVYAPQDTVTPGVMSVFASLNTIDGNKNWVKSSEGIPATMDKRRSAFAKWLTDSQNPVFVRSIVNRVWQYHFGKGIAETPNNFGATGGKPTHPELLDWLSHYFIENDWSIKKLHKLIMTSEAYQMASEHPNREKVDLVDPDNQWLTYFTPRRLEAEEMKDAMLAISGELNTEVGGFPVRPEINQEVALQPRHTMGSIAPAYQPSRTPEERNRRSIYAERYRTLIDPDLEVFNKPGSELSCERRDESTVTPQVFTLFNGNNTRMRSLAMAHRLMENKAPIEDLVTNAIKQIWCREPASDELESSMSYLDKMVLYHQENEPIKRSFPTTVEREMFEEMTGEPFEYVEELDVFKDYIPDLQSWQVDVRTRAFADLIAVLFNSNEFVYVY